MPLLVTPAASPQALNAATIPTIGIAEMVPRSCTITPPKLLKNIKPLSIKSEFIAYASPDSTYAVTRKLLDGAKKEILIGIYDFTALYMKELLLNAMQRNVKVALMLDIDTKDEQKVFDDLVTFGCKGVEAPSCASKNIHYFPCSHEKVIVIDKEWCLVQSGNYSNNSIPFNEKDGGDPKHFVKGNRDMGVAIRSKPLAAFFAKVLRSDMKMELDAAGLQALAGVARKTMPELVEAVPKAIPSKLFPSKSFKPAQAVTVTPVLTPDNYMTEIPTLLANAKSSILIENQYIKSQQADVAKLLAAIAAAKKKNPALDVRIVLGKLFNSKEVPKEKKNIANIKTKFGLSLNKNIRYIDTKTFVHCHNKLIIVDKKTVLISSQNWSDTAVGKNREAGVIMEYPDIARYYAKIFEADWASASKKIPEPGGGSVAPESLAKGSYIKVVPADYEEV